MVIENNIETGMTIAFGMMLFAGAILFGCWLIVDLKVNRMKRETRKWVRENYKRI